MPIVICGIHRTSGEVRCSLVLFNLHRDSYTLDQYDFKFVCANFIQIEQLFTPNSYPERLSNQTIIKNLPFLLLMVIGSDMLQGRSGANLKQQSQLIFVYFQKINCMFTLFSIWIREKCYRWCKFDLYSQQKNFISLNVIHI